MWKARQSSVTGVKAPRPLEKSGAIEFTTLFLMSCKVLVEVKQACQEALHLLQTEFSLS